MCKIVGEVVNLQVNLREGPANVWFECYCGTADVIVTIQDDYGWAHLTRLPGGQDRVLERGIPIPYTGPYSVWFNCGSHAGSWMFSIESS